VLSVCGDVTINGMRFVVDVSVFMPFVLKDTKKKIRHSFILLVFCVLLILLVLLAIKKNGKSRAKEMWEMSAETASQKKIDGGIQVCSSILRNDGLQAPFRFEP